jgi:hypothetical protein
VSIEESKQEPVAWMNKHGACKTSVFREVEAGAKDEYTVPLYTHPPKREWVELTEAEFLEAAQIAERGNYLVAFQRIQTKIKEKNHGQD